MSCCNAAHQQVYISRYKRLGIPPLVYHSVSTLLGVPSHAHAVIVMRATAGGRPHVVTASSGRTASTAYLTVVPAGPRTKPNTKHRHALASCIQPSGQVVAAGMEPSRQISQISEIAPQAATPQKQTKPGPKQSGPTSWAHITSCSLSCHGLCGTLGPPHADTWHSEACMASRSTQNFCRGASGH